MELPGHGGATGTYNYRVNVTLGVNTVTSAPSATLTVTTGTSTLGVSSVAIPANLPPLFLTTNVDLTAEGVTDWAYWGYAGLGTYDTKANLIGNYTPIGSGATVFITSLTSFSWTDATTSDTSSGGPTTTTAAAIVDNGYELDVPVTTTPQLLNVYVSANYAWVHVEASLADGSAPLFVDNPQTTLGTMRYTFAVGAASSTTLKVRITSVGRTVQASSVALQAATLEPVPALSVGTLVASPSNSVAVNLPVVVSLGTFDPQGRPTFSYVWQRDSGAGYVNLPDTGGRVFHGGRHARHGKLPCDHHQLARFDHQRPGGNHPQRGHRGLADIGIHNDAAHKPDPRGQHRLVGLGFNWQRRLLVS